MAYDSTFGNLDTAAGNHAAGTADTPFRVAVWGDFSGRRGRETPTSGAELAGRKPLKITHDTLDEVLESVAPRLQFSVAGGDVEVELEFAELDDFHPDAVARQVDRVTDLDDDGATELMREILHDPQYQSLESCWRGADWLLRRVAKNNRIQFVLFDVTADELAADLTASDDLSDTAVYKLLIEKTAEAPDGQPWAVLATNYTFDETAEHAELLGRMAKLAARAGAPFFAAVNSDAAKEGFEPPAEGKQAWVALRALPEAAYLGLVVPGFLLRPPFGENYRPADAFRFEEFSGAPEGYLWGGGGIACAGLLAQCFIKSGWGFQQGAQLSLDAMPMHTYRDADGEAVAVCTEARFTSSIGETLAERGFMPLLAVRGRDAAEIAAIRPLYQETKILAGRWEGGQGGGGSTGIGLGGSAVGMVSKGQAGGRPAPKRDGPAFVSAEPQAAPRAAAATSDPELDPDLAALLAGDDPPPQESAPEEPPGDDGAPAPEDAAPVELDPELAALLGDGGAAPAEAAPQELDPELAALLGESPAAPPAEEPLDPELAALLGDSSASESAPAPAAEEALDPDLAALLGESSAGESPPEPAAEELDPDLAALLGGGESAPAAEPEPEPALTPADEPLDPDLAALLGGDAAPGAESEREPAPAEESLDPDLAALLGDSSGVESEPAPASTSDESLDSDLAALLNEPAAEAEPSPEAEPPPSSSLQPPTSSLPMATVTDDRPDLESDDQSPAPAARNERVMAQDIDELLAQSQAATHYTGPSAGGPPVIDFKSLLAPISGDEPAGSGVPYDVRERLEQMRKEVNPEAFAADDPLRPTDVVKADWTGIIALAQDTLRGTSKNLLVAARLVEALTKKFGFVGLRDGLHLMRLLVEICWDRLDPPLEDEDMEVRAAPFNWLDDPDRGAYFPNSIRAVTLLAADGNQFSWQQWQQSQGAEGSDKIDRVIMAAPRERCQAVVDALSQTQLEIKQLMSYLGEKMGSEAPGLTAVRPALIDCYKLAQQILQRKGPAGATAESSADAIAGDAGAAGTAAVARPRFATRDDIYQELANAASALERLEPHSPVPFLVRRAVELGALPFPLLMQALIRDVNVLAEMNRELGIKSVGDNGGM